MLPPAILANTSRESVCGSLLFFSGRVLPLRFFLPKAPNPSERILGATRQLPLGPTRREENLRVPHFLSNLVFLQKESSPEQR